MLLFFPLAPFIEGLETGLVGVHGLFTHARAGDTKNERFNNARCETKVYY